MEEKELQGQPIKGQSITYQCINIPYNLCIDVDCFEHFYAKIDGEKIELDKEKVKALLKTLVKE